MSPPALPHQPAAYTLHHPLARPEVCYPINLAAFILPYPALPRIISVHGPSMQHPHVCPTLTSKTQTCHAARTPTLCSYVPKCHSTLVQAAHKRLPRLHACLLYAPRLAPGTSAVLHALPGPWEGLNGSKPYQGLRWGWRALATPPLMPGASMQPASSALLYKS